MQQLADGLKLAAVVFDVANIGEELHRGQPCLVGCKPPNARCGSLGVGCWKCTVMHSMDIRWHG